MADNLKIIDADGSTAYFKTTDTGSSVHQVWHKTQPFDGMIELGLTELVGTDEEVNTNDYGGSVGVALAAAHSGELVSFCFYSDESGSGAVQTPAGKLLILDADPAVSAGDTSLAAGEWPTILGIVDVSAADWLSDANGGAAYIIDQPVAFHSLSTLYLVWFPLLALDLLSLG